MTHRRDEDEALLREAAKKAHRLAEQLREDAAGLAGGGAREAEAATALGAAAADADEVADALDTIGSEAKDDEP